MIKSRNSQHDHLIAFNSKYTAMNQQPFRYISTKMNKKISIYIYYKHIVPSQFLPCGYPVDELVSVSIFTRY